MNPVQFIAAKREGKQHSFAEMEDFFAGYLSGKIPDYQVSAWLMAVCFQGMTDAEATALTQVMAASGEMLDLSEFPHTADKHSSGGVGDKTSLLIAPILAACGLTVAKMSGRGLGHTGGTIDKLESIPGWTGDISLEQFRKQAREIGIVLAAQTGDLAPLDGKLYALRDVTATVDCKPLIASSIMSKKLASGAHSIVLDVKVGSGAFMKTLEEARELASLMVAIGQGAGRQVTAVLSNMERPLGHAVGNALEVREAIETLQGKGAEDLLELSLNLAAEPLRANGIDPAKAREVVESGAALVKLKQFISAQGGDGTVADDPNRLQIAGNVDEIKASQSGTIVGLEALKIGQAVLALGGGRQIKTDAIDHSVGILLDKKPGDVVHSGDVLLRIFHNQKGLEQASILCQSAYMFGTNFEDSPLIMDIVR